MKEKKEKKIRSAVVRDSINTFGTNVFGAALSLVSSFIVLRRVDKVTKGLFNQMQFWGSGFFTILALSVTSAIIYYVAHNSVQNAKRAIWRLSVPILSGIVLIGSVVVFLLRDSSFFADTPRQFLAAIVIYSVLSFLSNVFMAILRGENKFKSYNLVNLFQRVLMAGLAVFIFFHPNAYIWVWSAVAVSFCMMLFALYGVLRWNGPKPVPSPENDLPVSGGSMLGYSLKSHVSNVLTYLNTNLGSYIVQGVYTIADYGVYNTAVTMMQQVWVLPNSVSQVILSRISGMNNWNDKVRLTLLSSKVVTYLTTAGAVALYWVAKLLVPVLFPIYVGALGPLAYLLIGSVFVSYSNVLGNSIAGYGHPELNIIPTATGIALNIAASVILLPLMGTDGIALATSISMTAQAVTCIVIFCRFSHTPFYRLLIPNRDELAMVMRIFHK
ncbi:MAG: polysaccharide biosynthesis C-terminal domain-containing protein [Oscillospiraceae bacterium]|jgi:O-antigen/teichoic acid export membrane protein|nr:polysaccharide biosynthesis C-terminal domain-containing protein [Oscillospiraceae bacterium]